MRIAGVFVSPKGSAAFFGETGSGGVVSWMFWKYLDRIAGRFLGKKSLKPGVEISGQVSEGLLEISAGLTKLEENRDQGAG